MAEISADILNADGFLQAITDSNRVSRAELDTLRIALQKKTAEEIASQLGISAAAVRKRLGAVYQKFDIHGTTPGKLESLKGILVKRYQEYAAAQTKPEANAQINWGEAISAAVFYDRHAELAHLKQIIVQDRCRLAAILGIGGIGKTTLSVKAAETVQSDFDYLIWRSLRESPTLHQILEDWFQILPRRSPEPPLETVGQKVTRLLELLKGVRCLLVIDNFESILQHQTRAGEYRPGYEDYGELLRRIGESAHRSCLLLTSREKPIEITALESNRQYTRTLELGGSEVAGLAILDDKGLSGSLADKKQLTRRYDGNPLALKIVATAINDLFDGQIAQFLAQQDDGLEASQKSVVVGNLRRLLDEQFNRLSSLEKNILYWLAIAREPLTLTELRQDIVIAVAPPSKFLEALEYLKRRSLIEKVEGSFTLQNVVMEYATDSLIETVCHEIQTDQLEVFNSHALLKANGKDYIRAIQTRLILTPLAQNLQLLIGGSNLRAWAAKTLDRLRRESRLAQGYAAGNLLNLLVHLEQPLTGYNFSQLRIRQAALQSTDLRHVDLSRANLQDCRFSETFGSVLCVAFSADGEYLAAGSADREIRLWRVRDNRPVHSLIGHSDWVWRIAYASEHSLLASGGADGAVRLWNTRTGNCLWAFSGHASRVWHLSFHNHGALLASGSDDGAVHLWDIEQKRSAAFIPGQGMKIGALALSPNCCVVARGCYNGELQIWDAELGQSVHQLAGHQGRIRAIAFSPQGQLMASADEQGIIQIWETASWTCLNTLSGIPERVRTVTFGPDGTVLASGSDDGKIRIWGQVHQLHQGRLTRTLTGHTNLIWSVAFSPDGHTLASGSEDQSIKRWRAQTGQCLSTLQGRCNRMLGIAISPKGDMIASGSEDHSVRLWRVDHHQPFAQLSGHTNRVRAVAFSPNGDYLASSSDDQSLIVRDLKTGESLYTFAANQDWVRTIAFSPNSQFIASGSDQSIRIWSLADGQPTAILQGHAGIAISVAFGPHPAYLASGSEDGSVKVWNIHTGTCIQTLRDHSRWVLSVAISYQGSHLASSGADKQICIWNMDSYALIHCLTGHSAPVRSVAFHRDGNLLASSSDDKTIRLWDLASGKCLKTLYGHSQPVSSVVFSPKDDTLFSSGDQSIRRWHSRTGECLSILPLQKPYEGVNISNVSGLSQAQLANLKALGAIADELPL